jgi:hypothetical protein
MAIFNGLALDDPKLVFAMFRFRHYPGQHFDGKDCGQNEVNGGN